jgi:hypothetical protein
MDQDIELVWCGIVALSRMWRTDDIPFLALGIGANGNSNCKTEKVEGA